jgi:uncharacterized membrane protein YraQ (UPF0718 family)
MKLLPAVKGVITAALMISVVLITYYSGMPANSPFQYLIYAFYALGIVWTIVAYRQSDQFTGRFADSFARGFRCFIIVILLMTIFTFVFSKMHPEFAEESAKAYREELIKDKSKLPDDIDKDIARYKKNYTTMLVYGSIIGYLIIGAGVTAAISAFIPKRKQ